MRPGRVPLVTGKHRSRRNFSAVAASDCGGGGMRWSGCRRMSHRQAAAIQRVFRVDFLVQPCWPSVQFTSAATSNRLCPPAPPSRQSGVARGDDPRSPRVFSCTGWHYGSTRTWRSPLHRRQMC